MAGFSDFVVWSSPALPKAIFCRKKGSGEGMFRVMFSGRDSGEYGAPSALVGQGIAACRQASEGRNLLPYQEDFFDMYGKRFWGK